MEKFPKPEKRLVDSKAYNQDPMYKDNLPKLKWELKMNENDSLQNDIENLEPAFEDFFKNIINEEPDYIILLDKGARPFGVPFEHYLNTLNLKKKPKIIFWNDSKYKNIEDKEKQAEAIGSLYQENTQLHGKKLFFVDETIYRGSGAKMLKNLFDTFDMDAKYFAFSEFKDMSEEERTKNLSEIEGDKRFKIYPNYTYELFSKLVSDKYVTDDENGNTIKRFSYSNESIPFDLESYNFSPSTKDFLTKFAADCSSIALSVFDHLEEQKQIEFPREEVINRCRFFRTTLTHMLAEYIAKNGETEALSKQKEKFIEKLDMNVLLERLINHPDQSQLHKMEKFARELRSSTMKAIEKTLSNIELSDERKTS